MLLITLLVVGLILILLDLFFIPGGIVAFIGLALIVYADYLSFETFGNTTGYIFTIVSLIASGFLIAQFFRPAFWNRFGPETEIDSKVNTSDLTHVKIGDKGRSIGSIRPSGTARFGNEMIEVHSRHAFIDANCEVEIIAIEENKIIVKPIVN